MKAKRYDEGGDVNEEFARPIKSTDDAVSETADAPAKKSFKSAFADARKAGDKTFTWEGKKYTTEMAKAKKESKPDQSDAETKRIERQATTANKKATFSDAVALGNRYADIDREQRAARVAARGGAGMKKGGAVKSSASSRADGCAQRGKTRGKMV
jgi:hypothetical protein